MTPRTLPPIDKEAFESWARDRFNLPDDVVQMSPGFYETSACVWVSRPNYERGWGLTSEHYMVPETPSIEALCLRFPAQPEAGQLLLDIGL